MDRMTDTDKQNRGCFKINDAERLRLQKPLGNVYSEKDVLKIVKGTRLNIISVGDWTTLMLLKHGVNPFISVIDYKMSRKHVSKEDKFILDEYFSKADVCVNPVGCISSCAVMWSRAHVQVGGRLIINGEEDLVAVPLIYYASKGTLILYGQRNEGTVVIEKHADHNTPTDAHYEKVIGRIMHRYLDRNTPAKRKGG